MSASPNKRRSGEVMGGAFVADPRPQIRDQTVLGARCAKCGYTTAPAAPWCPACQSRDQQPVAFGPLGTIWASTLVQIPVGRWKPPYAVAYVDMDEGPRVMAHLQAPQILKAGTRVRVVGADEGGDLIVGTENAA